jgi:uncharacterized protein (UPF0335 family)
MAKRTDHNTLGADAAQQMRALEERIQNLFDERDRINEDVAEVFKEASDAGFHAPTLREAIMKKRKIEKDEAGFRAAEEQLDLYFATLYQMELPFEPQTPGLKEQREAEDKAAKGSTVDEARASKKTAAPKVADPLLQ